MLEWNLLKILIQLEGSNTSNHLQYLNYKYTINLSLYTMTSIIKKIVPES